MNAAHAPSRADFQVRSRLIVPRRLYGLGSPYYAAWVAILLSLSVATSARAELTPDSPEVKRLIDNGMTYLEKNTDNRLGGKCLVALCELKQNGDPEHARVAEAVAACQHSCRGEPKDIREDIYSTGIAIFFLCEVDADKYSSEIEKYVQSLILRQRTAGGFGYPAGGNHGDTGDTSMTQYAALGLWTAKQHGINVPREVVERLANWLIRTQDPSGAWGYQGVDPHSYQRVKQSPLRPSLAAAGLGSVYISAHMLGLGREVEDRKIEGLPAAFQKIVDEKPKDKEPKLDTVEPRRIVNAQNDANRWFAQNFGYKNEAWVFYYMYALERCMSFRELVEGRKVSNVWYERGVRFLEEQQQDDGSWKDKSGPVDTAFAILFLMRGTRKTIEKTVSQQYDGLLVGSRGLPKDTSSVQVDNGRLVGKSLATSVEEMLAILEDPQHEQYNDALRFPPDLNLETTAAGEREAIIQRLKRIAIGGEPEAQIQAIDMLARSGELAVAPTLIASLTDDDLRVTLAARDGLRRLSRKFDGFGLSEKPDAAEITNVADQWRTWYRSIAP